MQTCTKCQRTTDEAIQTCKKANRLIGIKVPDADEVRRYRRSRTCPWCGGKTERTP